MGKLAELTGERFGRLVAIERSSNPYVNPASGYKMHRWVCKCDCGNITEVFVSSLKGGRTQSCGCLFKDVVTKHEMADTSVYKAHFAMKDRCNNENNGAFNKYGGRGITYDPKWETFEGFWEDMGKEYEEGLTLDRIDVDGNYCRENCRWANRSVQSYNRRMDATNSSGKTGVSYAKNVDKWYAYIDFEGKRISLKLHETFEEAVRVREEAELKYFGVTKE